MSSVRRGIAGLLRLALTAPANQAGATQQLNGSALKSLVSLDQTDSQLNFAVNSKRLQLSDTNVAP